jgi:hypothetical protein
MPLTYNAISIDCRPPNSGDECTKFADNPKKCVKLFTYLIALNLISVQSYFWNRTHRLEVGRGLGDQKEEVEG